VRREIALLAIALIAPSSAFSAPRWTFCVASSKGGNEVWMTGVFAAERDRERLEGEFRNVVERLSAMAADAQCPLPRENKMEAVNAQIDAEKFNRKLGAKLHAVAANEFPPRR
jgi:hypothetical protein